jgi:hypothetical protein
MQGRLTVTEGRRYPLVLLKEQRKEQRMGVGGDALPLSCVACVGLKVSLRGGVCVCVCMFVCLLCLIFVCKNCSNSLVDRTHGFVRSILDTIKRRMCQCRFVTEISFKILVLYWVNFLFQSMFAYGQKYLLALPLPKRLCIHRGFGI